ncbi:MAG: alpha/beta hydrolase [Candidatus Eremiobacteraeota bacterium]|nr:alpha/beta hydrolase [Candidatus Eremiobacteraeota bacterium]
MPQISDFNWVDRREYPFRSHYHATQYGAMHYVDEGSGDVVLCLHGNPTWSFMYRHVIKGLSGNFRVVAPDYLGFGLSDKPWNVSYRPQFHAETIEHFIEKLGLKNITLVVHDWGGAIGMSYAVSHPENIARLIILNTSAWPIKGNKSVEQFSALLGGPVGIFLCRYFNAFPSLVMPFAYGDKKKLTKAIHRQYIKPFPTPTSRKGTWVLPKAITGERDWLASIWAKHESLTHRPIQLLWGLKDPAFSMREVERWRRSFSNHTVHTFADVGHFVLEELGPDAVPLIESFLDADSRGTRVAI